MSLEDFLLHPHVPTGWRIAHASQTGTEKAHWVGNLRRITGGFLMPAWPVSTQAQGPELLQEAAGASSAR